jgi:hypothetical protein
MNDSNMKAFINMSIVALIFFSSTVVVGAPVDETPLIGPKYKNLFVFKTEKKLVGAKVEVLSENGQVVTSQVLQKRKMIIDFCDVRYGTYTIRVTKGENVKEYQYIKK